MEDDCVLYDTQIIELETFRCVMTLSKEASYVSACPDHVEPSSKS